VVAASRRPSESFAQLGADDLCIRADGDPGNERRGCFIERGTLSSFYGEAIAPIRNYGGAYYGGVTTVRELLVRSINTASAYLAGRLRLAGIRGFYELVELTTPYDLLPQPIGHDPSLSVDLERWPSDPLIALPARLGELPAGDTWRTSYDVRLGISGFSDFSLLHVGVATAILARDGRHYRPTLVRGVRDLADGALREVTPPNPLQVATVRVARHLKQALVETARRGTARGLRRMVSSPELWRELGAKTGTAETVRLQPGARVDEGRRKPRTQDHKFVTGFWPQSQRRPYVIVTAFEHVSHLDVRVALRMFAATAEALAARVTR
jgi:cell division protein FtsI/penicillin-binding protein 2